MATWIFLRGLMRESRHWGDFPAAFSALLPGPAPVLLDLPGNGRLHRLRSFARINDMTDWCRNELSARSIAPPYHLLGLSMGGMIAADWGTRHPQDLAGCVLINPSFRGFDPFYRRLKPRAIPALLSLFGRDTERQERTILRLTSSRHESQAGILDDWIHYRREYPVTRINALSQLLAAARYRAPERKPETPVLVLTGNLDRLVDTRCSRNLAANWQAALAIHQYAGHDLPFDDAPWVIRQVGRWLAVQSAPRPAVSQEFPEQR